MSGSRPPARSIDHLAHCRCGPASGVDPDEAQDELLSWFLSSGFELLGSPGPGPTELPHENERVRVDLASGDQPVIAFQEASVNARYGWDVARWAEAMRKGTDEVAEFEARRDADAAALLEAARPRG